MYIVDIDDFHETNHRLDLLERIKGRVPTFQATMFTIVGRCSLHWIKKIRTGYTWLDMVPHGLVHDTPRECEHWTLDECRHYLDFVEGYGLTRGFKAPGWQISDGMYQALLERDYWVADQAYNNERRPAKLRAYILDAPHKLHFHVQNVCGNGLEESLEQLLSLRPDEGFGLVKDVILRHHNSAL